MDSLDPPAGRRSGMINPAGISGYDAEAFIRANIPLVAAPSIAGIRVHTAQPSTGLWRLLESRRGAGALSPYWAYPWAGGIALAMHFLAHPEIVWQRRVLDLGAGGGLVAIAAAKAGAASVTAADIDPLAAVATKLNAVANGADVLVVQDDLTMGPPPAVDVVAVGDLFYDQDLALRVTAFLDRCLAAGIEVLVGDPGRAFLPYQRLRPVADYQVADFGETSATKPAGVFSFTREGEGG
ncbi:50S ribosomal protein L11 methyltransferase [Mesorhizobium sp. KR9-304]|uniref:class I SAM-dependent methyltransferase n=1 Tax=Mesorhizobium sp. KR9-304 TaxID=3156614 RepID=UPI0032B622BF